MRRRNHFMRKRADLFTHTQNSASQYNLQVPLGRIAKPENRIDLLDHFDDPSVKMSLAANLDMISAYDKVIDILEQDIISCANAHLRWAFSQAAQLFLKNNERGKRFHARLCNKHGKGKALSILAHKLGRAVFYMLKNRRAFDMNTFLAAN